MSIKETGFENKRKVRFFEDFWWFSFKISYFQKFFEFIYFGVFTIIWGIYNRGMEKVLGKYFHRIFLWKGSLCNTLSNDQVSISDLLYISKYFSISVSKFMFPVLSNDQVSISDLYITKYLTISVSKFLLWHMMAS